jgi:dephospho-CoA kinase
MRVIGLTGGIAAGKSTVSEALRDAGAVVIDADKVGHAAYQPGTETFAALVEAFGQGIVAADGQIDRRALGGIVFADPAQRQRLQDVVWPRMKTMMRGQLDELRGQGTEIAVIEAAVLVEADWLDLVDEVWAVQVPEAVAQERLMTRNGFSAEESQSRIRAQLTNEERARHARVVIDNSGSVEDARARVQEALESARGRAGADITDGTKPRTYTG